MRRVVFITVLYVIAEFETAAAQIYMDVTQKSSSTDLLPMQSEGSIILK